MQCRYWCLLSLLLLSLLSCHGDQLAALDQSPVRIASFNIQVFGVTKMSKPEVVDILLRILHRYDMVFIMEIRDISGKAIKDLLQQLNDQIPDQHQQFHMIISERLGRTSSKEQYAFFYRHSKFRVLDIYQYKDPNDVFERPPYGAIFEVYGAEKIQRFGVLGIHAAPNDAVAEMQELHRVQNLLKTYWSNQNLFILGDFNADCTYLNRYEHDNLLLRQDKSLHWLITGCHEATALKTRCVYDRIVASGSSLQKAIEPNSGKVFYFDKFYELNRQLAESVSDHFPVEVQLTGKSRQASLPAIARWSDALEVTQFASQADALLLLWQSNSASLNQTGQFSITSLSGRSGQHRQQQHLVVAERHNVDNAIEGLRDFRLAFPGVLHQRIVDFVVENLSKRASGPASISISCQLRQLQCSVRIAEPKKLLY